MNSDPSNPLLIVALLSAIGAVIPAMVMERRRKRSGRQGLPYAWGYFQGIGAEIFGAVVAAIALVPSVGGSDAAGVFVFGALYIALGTLVIKRNKWGWVALTILNLNPFSWIVNGIYIKNRWKELGPVGRRPTAPVPQPVPPRDDLVGQLEKLEALRASNALSDEEFEAAKHRLLSTSRTSA